MAAQPDILDTERGWLEAMRVCSRHVRAVLGAGPAADDAVQEAVLRVWRHRAQCRDPERPWPWVASIARREALRVAARPGTVELDEAIEAPAGPDLDQRLAVQDALSDLEDLDREVVIQRYVLDRTSAEIGEIHGMSAGAVRVRLHRSRSRLRTVLAES